MSRGACLAPMEATESPGPSRRCAAGSGQQGTRDHEDPQAGPHLGRSVSLGNGVPMQKRCGCVRSLLRKPPCPRDFLPTYKPPAETTSGPEATEPSAPPPGHGLQLASLTLPYPRAPPPQTSRIDSWTPGLLAQRGCPHAEQSTEPGPAHLTWREGAVQQLDMSPSEGTVPCPLPVR